MGSGLAAEPLTERCRWVLGEGEHACIGVSPFNSYFSAGRIGELAAWAAGNFASFHMFVPDRPAELTLRALGYSPGRARVKARQQGNYVRNKIRRALTALGVAEPDALILDSAALDTRSRYQELTAAGTLAFESGDGFRSGILSAVDWVLAGKARAADLPVERRRLAAGYLLAELPLFTDTPGIVGAGSSVFCYHQAPPFIRDLFARRLPWRPGDRQGFAVVGVQGSQ